MQECGAAGHGEGCTEVSPADASHEICVQIQILAVSGAALASVHCKSTRAMPLTRWIQSHASWHAGTVPGSFHAMALTSRCISTQQPGDV